jgi:hypothetical protein
MENQIPYVIKREAGRCAFVPSPLLAGWMAGGFGAGSARKDHIRRPGFHPRRCARPSARLAPPNPLGGIGALVGFAVEYHLRRDIAWRQPIHFCSLPATGLLVATMIGEKLHQIQAAEEANKRYFSTLFGEEPDR